MKQPDIIAEKVNAILNLAREQNYVCHQADEEIFCDVLSGKGVCSCGLKKYEDMLRRDFSMLLTQVAQESRRETVEECADAVAEASKDYNPEGMGCGLEDRNITDRYQAMEHGFEKALEMVMERMPATLTKKEEVK